MFNYITCLLVSKDKFEIESGILTKASIFYITDGEIQYIINGIEETAGAGDLVCFPADLYFERKIIKPVTFYHIFFENPQKAELPCGKIFFADKARLMSSLDYLYNLELNPEDRGNLKNYFLNDIFVQRKTELLIRHVEKDEIVIKAMEYFEKNYDRKITLEEVSAEIGVSVPCMINHFKKTLKITPIKYLTGFRIKNAEKLLCTTDLPVSRISEKCGFENPYYFSNTFKKYNKVSPMKFRRIATI